MINRIFATTVTVALTCVIFTLVGCAPLGPNFTRPLTPTRHTYAAADTSSNGRSQGIVYGGQVADDWFTLFHSEELNGLVCNALRNNPNLEAARRGLLAAQYELQAVSGAAWPQLEAMVGISRAHANGSLLYGPVNAFSATANVFSLGPALAYNLDVFGGVRRSIESQAAATASDRDKVLNTYVTLVGQVVVTAFDYAATQAEIDTTQSLIDDLRAQLDLIERLEVAGKITHSDALQAQAQLQSTRATLPAIEQKRDTYRNVLAQLTGTTPDEFRMPTLTLKDFALPAELPLSLPSALVRQRPDILAAENRLHQASALIGVAEAARFPSLSITGQYAQQTTKLNELFTQPGGIWSAGLSVSAPIFNGGALAARAHEAKERYAQSQASYRSTVLNAFVEVADALGALHHDVDSYAAHKRALDAADSSRDLAEAQLRAGKVDALQVLITEQQYQNAALAQVHADAQRFTDIALLFRALGGGWWNAARDPSAVPATSVR